MFAHHDLTRLPWGDDLEALLSLSQHLNPAQPQDAFSELGLELAAHWLELPRGGPVLAPEQASTLPPEFLPLWLGPGNLPVGYWLDDERMRPEWVVQPVPATHGWHFQLLGRHPFDCLRMLLEQRADASGAAGGLTPAVAHQLRHQLMPYATAQRLETGAEYVAEYAPQLPWVRHALVGYRMTADGMGVTAPPTRPGLAKATLPESPEMLLPLAADWLSTGRPGDALWAARTAWCRMGLTDEVRWAHRAAYEALGRGWHLHHLPLWQP